MLSKYTASQADAGVVVMMQTFLEVLTFRLLPFLPAKNSTVLGDLVLLLAPLLPSTTNRTLYSSLFTFFQKAMVRG
jgi:hypothetical protein